MYTPVFTTLETSESAFFSVDLQGSVMLWSSGCENLFGFTKVEVSRHFPPPFVTEQSYNDYYRSVKRVLSGETFSFTFQCTAPSKGRFLVKAHVSPIRNQERIITGFHGFFQRLNGAIAAPKRTFSLLRSSILLELFKGNKTINQISLNTNINWKTVDKHLVYLLGKKYVAELFSSKFVRVFGITTEGKQYLMNSKESPREKP